MLPRPPTSSLFPYTTLFRSYELHLVFGEHPLEQRPVEDRSSDLAIHQPGHRLVEPGQIQRDNRAAGLERQPLDETVADFAAGAGDQHNGLSHREIILARIRF